MTFSVNNQSWEIKEVAADCGKLVVDGSFRQGTTHFDTQTMYILNTLTESRKREVILHELAHCFLYATQIHCEKDSFSEEEVCEFVALYSVQMVNIMNEHFKVKEMVGGK